MFHVEYLIILFWNSELSSNNGSVPNTNAKSFPSSIVQPTHPVTWRVSWWRRPKKTAATRHGSSYWTRKMTLCGTSSKRLENRKRFCASPNWTSPLRRPKWNIPIQCSWPTWKRVQPVTSTFTMTIQWLSTTGTWPFVVPNYTVCRLPFPAPTRENWSTCWQGTLPRRVGCRKPDLDRPMATSVAGSRWTTESLCTTTTRSTRIRRARYFWDTTWTVIAYVLVLRPAPRIRDSVLRCLHRSERTICRRPARRIGTSG